MQEESLIEQERAGIRGIEWSSAFDTGAAEIDEQHRRLIELFNQLADLPCDSGERLLGLLDELYDYTRIHFRAEQALMQRWPVSDRHRTHHGAAHRAFVAFIEHAREMARSDVCDAALDMLNFLAHWLAHHIMIVDKRLIAQVSALACGDNERARLVADDDIVRAVVEANREMGERTLALARSRRNLREALAASCASQKHAERLRAFNRLLLNINQAMTRHDCEKAFLGEVCRIAVRYSEIHLCWIATARAGRFERVAAGGEADALDEITVSTHPDEQYGRGLIARVWRSGVAEFCQDFAAEPALAPWHGWANRFDLRSVAVLPLYRNGRIWAVMVLYHNRTGIFDDEMRHVLNQITRDISRGLERIDLTRREHESTEIRESLLNNALAGIVMTKKAVIIDANQHFARMLGFENKAQLIGMRASKLYPDRASFEAVVRQFPGAYSTQATQMNSVRLCRRDGQIISCDISGSHSREFGSQLMVWTVIDVSERDRLKAQLVHESGHDALTGLPNRRALDQSVGRRVESAVENGRSLAVCMIDLNDFKAVNDTHGHAAGDRVLGELAERLRQRMRGSDFVARLGGDEFVIIIDELSAERIGDELSAVLRRLHQAVETPFRVTERGDSVRIGMSLGVALCPQDGREVATLFKAADKAMYAAKASKHAGGDAWWQCAPGSASLLGPHCSDTSVRGEGAHPMSWLADSASLLAQRFIERFYSEMRLSKGHQKILANLSDDEMKHLAKVQQEHLAFIADPQVSVADIARRAHQLGCIHALCGVGPAWLMRGQFLYRRLVQETLYQRGVDAKRRRCIMTALESRLELDMESQMGAVEHTHSLYMMELSQPLPDNTTMWGSVSQDGLSRLSKLPGVRAALMMSLTADGHLEAAAFAGECGKPVAALLGERGHRITLDGGVDGMVTSAQAWVTLAPAVCDAFAKEAHYAPWREHLHALGMRASMSVPVMEKDGRPAAVITLFGAYPNQFSSQPMRHFANGLQRRWAELRAMPMEESRRVSESASVAYRKALLAGGLRMVAQPVIDLITGELRSVESLARLRMADGRIIAPGAFLQTLSSAEIDRLFVMTLDQSLRNLRQWEGEGLCTSVSVNISPTTLLDVSCAHRVGALLQSHGITPDRLTLEILEGERLLYPQQERSIIDLREMGISLAMDDLGSGYSSLQRLSRLPFDIIKIDQSLALAMEASPLQNMTLIDTILRIGTDFERTVIIEGLENAAIIEAAHVMGARYGQGYGLARPMSADLLVAWQRKRAAGGLQRAAGIHHALGALAYLWQMMHRRDEDNGRLSAQTVAPLRDYLSRLKAGPDVASAQRWAASMAEGLSAPEARLLMNWLLGGLAADSGDDRSVARA